MKTFLIQAINTLRRHPRKTASVIALVAGAAGFQLSPEMQDVIAAVLTVIGG